MELFQITQAETSLESSTPHLPQVEFHRAPPVNLLETIL